MLPLVPAREQQDHDVLQHAGLGHEQHDDMNMDLENMLPLQQVFNLDQDKMLEDGNRQLREQVMSPRKRDQQQQVHAVQDRQFAFANQPANVVEEHRRQENDGGNVFLQQRNILQQMIHQFQQPPQLEFILENQRDVMHQLVQEAHRVRQEVKDIKTAMVNALQTVDANHAGHDQIIQAQAQGLQRLSARQDGQETAIQSVLEAQSRLHASMLAQERESAETQKARLEVLERFLSEHLTDAIKRLPAEIQNLNQRLVSLEESSSKSQLDQRTLASMIDNHQEWQTQVEAKLSDLSKRTSVSSAEQCSLKTRSLMNFDLSSNCLTM